MREQILALVVATLAALVPLVRAYVKAKLTPERLAHVTDIARMAVRAAERLAGDLGDFLEGETPGAAKLDFAVDVVITGAKRLGIHLTYEEAVALVHATLREMELDPSDA